MPVIDDRYGSLMDIYVLTGFTTSSLRVIPELWNPLNDMVKDGLVKSLHHRTVFEAEAFIVDFIDNIPSLSKHDVEKRHYLIQDMEQ